MKLFRPGQFVQTPDGPGFVRNIAVKQIAVLVALDTDPERWRSYSPADLEPAVDKPVEKDETA